MQVTETLSDGLKRSYAVTVPAAEIESRTKSKLADIGKTLRLPGFRPGKVPANLVRQRYGSAVMAEVMQDAVSSAADRVVEDGKLRPAGQPRISLAREPSLAGPAQDLEIKVDLEVLPDIVLPDLTAISLTRLRAEPATEVIDRALESIAKQNRELALVEEDRPAATGDILVVDFSGSIDGVPFDGGTGVDTPVELGGSGFIPGFAEQIEGMRVGETRTIDVTFPAEYQAANLAGQAAQFSIVAKALKHPAPTVQDDSLAAKIGFENFDKLRDAVRGQMQGEFDQMSRLRIKRDLLDALAEQALFEAPPSMLEVEFNAIWQRVEADRAQGQQDEEDRGKDEETLRAEYRAIADRRVRLGLLLSEIGRVNEIQVSPSELSAALRAEAARYPGQEMQVVEFFRKNQAAIEQLRGPIFEDKVVDHILSVAQVEEKLVSPEELNLAGLDGAAETPLLEAGEAGAVTEEPAVAAAAEPQAEHAAEPQAEHAAEPQAEHAAEPQAEHAAEAVTGDPAAPEEAA
jgi:trigger factor